MELIRGTDIKKQLKTIIGGVIIIIIRCSLYNVHIKDVLYVHWMFIDYVLEEESSPYKV